MPEQTTEAAPQPAVAPVATQSSGEKTSSAGNQTVQQYARRLFSEAEAAPAEPAAAPAAETTETAPAIPAETQPEAAPKAETPEATPEEKADDALSKSTSQIEFTPEQQEVFNKRLGKEIAKRKELERQLEEAKAKPVEVIPSAETKAEPTTIVPLPSGVAPLANINDVKGLIELQQQAKEAIRFAEDALASADEGEPLPEYRNDAGVSVPYTRKTLRDVIRNAKLTVEDHIPARNQFLQQRNQMQQTAYELLPWLKDKTDPNYVLAQTFRQNNPWLQNLPAGDLIVGMYVKGVEATKAEREAAEKAKAKPTSAKTTPKPSGAQTEVSADAMLARATPGTQTRQAVKAIEEKLTAKRGVGAKDYAASLAQRETLKNR